VKQSVLIARVPNEIRETVLDPAGAGNGRNVEPGVAEMVASMSVALQVIRPTGVCRRRSRRRGSSSWSWTLMSTRRSTPSRSTECCRVPATS